MSEARETRLIGAPQCGNCKWSTVVTTTSGNMQATTRRECRRYPPTVTTFMVGRDRESGAPLFLNHNAFPQVLDTNECGEHKMRLEGMN
jgi:hypothetical protein